MSKKSHKNLDIQIIQRDTDLGGAKMEAYVDHLKWFCGISIGDWRKAAVRIANIDTVAALGVTGTQATTAAASNMLYLMRKALRRVPNLRGGRFCWYLPRDLASALDVMLQKSILANLYKTEQIDGQPFETFGGIPIKISDELTYAEDRVIA